MTHETAQERRRSDTSERETYLSSTMLLRSHMVSKGTGQPVLLTRTRHGMQQDRRYLLIKTCGGTFWADYATGTLYGIDGSSLAKSGAWIDVA